MNDHWDQESGRSRNTATAKPQQRMASIKASMAVRFVMSQCSVEIVSKQSGERRSARPVSTVVYRGRHYSNGKRQLKSAFTLSKPVPALS
jgi:hypothetical protein